MRRVLTALIMLCVAAVSMANDRLSDPTWLRAQAALARSEWAIAAEYFKVYREVNPEEAFAWVMEAWSRKSLGEVAASTALYAGALKVDPEQPDALYYMAHKAFEERDQQTALDWLSRFRQIPDHIQRDYHHLYGVVLALADKKPQAAIDHLERVDLTQGASRLLLALEYARIDRWDAAEPLLDEACQRNSGQSLVEAWMTCLDADYCGELARQRLEILERLFDREASRGSLGDVVRIHLRHSTCPESLLGTLEHGIDETSGEERCVLQLLHALSETCLAAESSACRSLRKAQSCAWSDHGPDTIALSGPVFDPETGAILDLIDMKGTTDRLISLRCAADVEP